MKINFSLSRRGVAAGTLALLIAASAPRAAATTLQREDRLSPLAAGYVERARLMIDDGNFAGVVDQLKHLDTQGVNLAPREREDCMYLLAIALYERADADCVDLLREFSETYPASSLALPARLAAADYFFFAGHFANALAAYNDIDYSRIQPSDRPLYQYRKALSMIKIGHAGEAREILEGLKGIREYSTAAIYYLAYIDYSEGNTDQAYAGFSEVEDLTGGKDTEGLAPAYYMAQIDYTRGDYEKVISLGSRLLRQGGMEELEPEIRRIVGLSYFKTGDYEAAKDMLMKYARIPDITTAADAEYALGVIEYRDDNLSAARDRFARLTDLNNDLAQSAYLYLGQISVKEGDSNAAAISFEKASKMNFDRNVTEAALYNYIAARTRGGNIPFSSSIPLITGFLREFPHSGYAPEVREYLANAYFNEKDYANALASINEIRNPSAKVLGVKQKVLYELGMESMSNNRPEQARRYLSEATSIKGEADIRAQAYLWLGDACYALGKYADAEKAYTAYLQADRRGENRTLATYNLAYSLLLQDKYQKAVNAFADAMKADPMLPKRLYDDALIRMADAQYYAGSYNLALKNYTSAIENGAYDRDYATYRRAVMYGLAGDIKRKLSELSSMPSAFPGSKWLPAALLEKGQTYNGLGDTDKAVEAFEQLRTTYKGSAQARKGMLNLAISYMEKGQDAKGESAYREVISRWPSSDEASMANEDLRRYYASNGRLTEYAEFLRSVPDAPQMNADEMEKLAFEGAETAFSEDITSISLLEKYVADYPNGRYLSRALLDIAEGRNEKGDDNGALDALRRLLDKRADSPQVGEALLLKATILEGRGASSRKEALSAFRELEKRSGAEYAADAFAGIMRTTDKDSERMKYAALVKNSAGLSADQLEEAELYEASAMLNDGNVKKAEEVLLRLASNPKSLSGAKAAVTLGQFYIDNGNISGADKVLTAFTEAGTPHEYWLARGFISLADVCHLRNKDYLAVEYLKSLRDNYPGKELDIHDMINSRLEKWKK
ncbi:MAG: tetratricopeptide repeat protein [Muribaculaceae bacterium]|nr:tetratricopeptide repeat protein [Muribaculaceae bacterium]